MAEITYSSEEFEAAKEYLRRRTINEYSMESDIERLLDEYAGYLLHALFSGASESDIELLIEDLISRIIDDCTLLAVDEHDVSDELLAYVFDAGDVSVKERIESRARTFLDEMTVLYSAAEILQMDEQTILASAKEYMVHPWDNEFIQEVRDMIGRGEVDEDIEYYEKRHYGRGSATSSMVEMKLITVSAVADMWNQWDWDNARKLGAKGYYIERGSSYPCDTCEDHTGRFFPIDDREHIPQYHRNCRCFVVFCYDDDDMDSLI